MKATKATPEDGGEDDYIYSAFITLRNGKRLYAHQVGLKVFRFPKRKGYKKKPR